MLLEDFNALEVKKSQRYQELAKLIKNSHDKLKEIHLKQTGERKTLEETETSEIEQRKKTLKMEQIRVDVTR